MKILGISAGTKDGSNDCMCKEGLMGAVEMGAEVEFINLFDLELKHCTGCVACVNALFSGKGNMCVLKDDFDWLYGKIAEAQGILFAVPIFEKGAAGIFHTIMDRFGPRCDNVNNIVAGKIAEKTGGKVPDARYTTPRAVSYMGIGGSDWITRVQCDFGIQALTPMWKVIDNEVFGWSLGILADRDKVARARQIGRNLAEAAKDLTKAEYKGEAGVCPHCQCREFYFSPQGKAICCLCGIIGDLERDGDAYRFVYPEEQFKHAHNTLDGKFIHADDINTNNTRLGKLRHSPEYKEWVQEYKNFITATRP